MPKNKNKKKKIVDSLKTVVNNFNDLETNPDKPEPASTAPETITPIVDNGSPLCNNTQIVTDCPETVNQIVTDCSPTGKIKVIYNPPNPSTRNPSIPHGFNVSYNKARPKQQIPRQFLNDDYCPLYPTSHPLAFTKLPYRVQHSRPMDYRYVDYEYAGYKCRQYGITSARTYRAWQQSFKPAGFPSNPPRAYADYWVNWNEFLHNQNEYAGFAPESVKASELLPYKDAVILAQSKQFETVDKFKEAWDNGMMPAGMPKHPDKRYSQFHAKGGWKFFLGKKLEHRIDAKKDLQPVCVLCSTVGQSSNVLQLVIDSQGAGHLQQQLAKATHLVPLKAYHWYHDYGMYVFELLDKMGTKQNENTWLFPDVNALYYELGSVLEEYRAG